MAVQHEGRAFLHETLNFKQRTPPYHTHTCTHTHLFFIPQRSLQFLYGLVKFSLLGFDHWSLVALALKLRHLKGQDGDEDLNPRRETGTTES